jgi:ureidoacrylate peracid hydrolase
MDLQRLRAKADPLTTAVITVDMQRDYCCEGGTFHKRGYDVACAQGLAARLKVFLDQAREVIRHIIHLKMVKVPGLSSEASAELYERLGIERNYDPAFAEFYGVVPREGDTVIGKYRYSGFFLTYLDQFLRCNGIKTLVITGIATNVCVESTARDGFMRDYYIIVPSDLTEGTSAEAKKWTLANIDTFFGQVVDSASLLQCWNLTR